MDLKDDWGRATVDGWVKTACTCDLRCRTATATLYQAFSETAGRQVKTQYMAEDGSLTMRYGLSATRFTKILSALGFERVRTSQTRYTNGLRLKTPDELAAERSRI